MSNYGKPIEEIEQTKPVFTVKDLLEKTQCGLCFNSHAHNMSFEYDAESDRFKSFGFHDINCDINGDDVSFYFIGKYIEAINMLNMEVSYIDTADYDIVAFGVVNDDTVPVVEVKRSLNEELLKIDDPTYYKNNYLNSNIKVPEGTTFKDMDKIAKKFFGDDEPKVHVFVVTDPKPEVNLCGLPIPPISLFKIDGVYYGYISSHIGLPSNLPSKLKDIDDLIVKGIDFRVGTMNVTISASEDNFEKCTEEPKGERDYGSYKLSNGSFPFALPPGTYSPFSNLCTSSNPAVLQTFTVADAIELCNNEEYKIVNYSHDHDIDPDDVYTLEDNVWVTPTKYLFALGHIIDANDPVPVGWITKYRYDFTNEAMMTRPARFRVKIDNVNVIFIDRPFCPTHANLESNDHYFNKRIEIPGYLNFKTRSIIFDYLEKECGTIMAKVYLDNKGCGLKNKEEKFGLTLDENNNQCFKSSSGKVIYLEDDVEDTRVTAFTVGNSEVLDYTGELFVTGRLLTEED